MCHDGGARDESILYLFNKTSIFGVPPLRRYHQAKYLRLEATALFLNTRVERSHCGRHQLYQDVRHVQLLHFYFS